MRWQLLILAVLPACSPWRAGTAYGVSSGHPDYWGHRPGPAGFGTVVLDAGHGGKDAGATAVISGVKEKDLALDTARRVQRKLAGKLRVVMIRDDDRFVDLDQRVAMASHRRAAVLVSVHYNSGRSTLRGPETYYWRVDSHGLANRIQQRLAASGRAFD